MIKNSFDELNSQQKSSKVKHKEENNLKRTKNMFLTLPKDLKYATVSICSSKAQANEIETETQQKNLKWMENIHSFIQWEVVSKPYLTPYLLAAVCLCKDSSSALTATHPSSSDS